MKKIIYTVLLGDYKLNEPEFINKNWSLICFTDRDIVSENWSIIKVECNDLKKKSREIKIRCNEFIDFDICVYIDAKFTIKCNLDEFVKLNLSDGTDIAVMRHRRRSCVYEEGKFCIKNRIGDGEIIADQIISYYRDGFPRNFGLYAPGIMIRRNSLEVIDFMKMWYNEVKKYSYRDIISFSYVLWRNPIKLSVMPFKKTYKEFR